jgi:zinc protease
MLRQSIHWSCIVNIIAFCLLSTIHCSLLVAMEIPRLNYKERTLNNGLKVYTIEDHTSPTVAIHVWYHVGSKDDPDKRSGFAHLFEHMMFKRTKNMKDEMLDRLTEDVGGYNNAFTADDVTVYHEVVPSNYLETLIWAEADRLASLTVDETNFKSERDVVKEEFRQSYLTPPYGKLQLLIEQRSYITHPYKRPGIGNIEELNAATIEDVRAFHQTYYRPDNATLIVAGDFDEKDLQGWIDKYFGRIPRPEGTIPRVTVKEPERIEEQRYIEYGENVPLPAIAVTFKVPSASSDDAFALKVAETILSDGPSSRLNYTLVYKEQVAQNVVAYADLREDLGMFTFNVVLASGKGIKEVEQLLNSEIEKMRTGTITPAELEKAKNKILTHHLNEYETNNGKALALGQAAVILNDPERVNKDIDRFLKITASDVQRVMQKFFTEKNRMVIHYLPEEMKPKANGAG